MSNYQPAPHVLDRLKQVDFVGVIGPTAAGKNAVMKAAATIEPALHEVMNSTSRVPRAEEHDGMDYNFHTHSEMQAKIDRGGYAQVAPAVFGDLYATDAKDYATKGVAILPVLAESIPTFRARPFKRLRFIYIVPPNWQEWQRRIADHHFTPDKIAGRLAEAGRSLTIALNTPDLLFIVNNDLAQAAQDFADIAMRRKSDESIRAGNTAARKLVQTLLHELKEHPII